MACAVLPNGDNNAAIQDDATDGIIFPFNLSAATITFHVYVFPVLPLPYTKKHFPRLESSAFTTVWKMSIWFEFNERSII